MKSPSIDSDSVFKAIADRTRRGIFHVLIAGRKPLTITQLTDHFSLTRQGITRHIKTLEEAGLIIIISKGREKICHANPRPLKDIQDWVSTYSKFWDKKLDDLGTFLDENPSSEEER